jgi:hypothetical protein
LLEQQPYETASAVKTNRILTGSNKKNAAKATLAAFIAK